MRKLTFSFFLALLTTSAFAQVNGDLPQLSNSSQKDSATTGLNGTPRLQSAELNNNSATIKSSNPGSSANGASKTPVLSDATPPKKDY